MFSGLMGRRKLPPKAKRIANGATAGETPDETQKPASTGTNRASHTPPTGQSVKMP